MRQQLRRLTALLLALCLLGAGLSAAAAADYETALEDTATYLQTVVTAPGVGSVGGEWAVLGLARSGCDVPDAFYQRYYAALEDYVTAREGVLHSRKYTEYSRVVLALTALGKDPTAVAGYDLLAPLGDYDKVVWQGVNGPIWALIALDAGAYTLAGAPNIRAQYVQNILDRQLADGGFSVSRDSADVDMTAMALQALAGYRGRADVDAAVERALNCLSALQQDNGGFPGWGGENAEGSAQVLVALTALGLGLDDSRFVKNGQTVLDGLLAYYVPGGGFCHAGSGAEVNQMATEQSFYALVALRRAQNGQSGLYQIDDPLTLAAGGTAVERHPDVQSVPVTKAGTTFPDIADHADRSAIEALAARAILDGMGDGRFAPDETMTRAQFTALVVRALGLKAQGGAAGSGFSDVPADRWYHDYVLTAAGYGLIQGRGAGIFDPEGKITRQEAAILVCNAAALCGLDTTLSAAQVRDLLAPFGDYTTSADWARPALAACCGLGLLDSAALNIRPRENILRCEIAAMVYKLLDRAELL